MTSDADDLPTRIERSGTPGSHPAMRHRAPGSASEVSFVARCDNEGEFIRRFHPFVDRETLILPVSPRLGIGEERRFRISFADGPVLLRGLCGAIERLGPDEGHGDPEWVRVQILELDAPSTRMRQRLLLAREDHGACAARPMAAALARLARLIAPASPPRADEATVILDPVDFEIVDVQPYPPVSPFADDRSAIAPPRPAPAARLVTAPLHARPAATLEIAVARHAVPRGSVSIAAALVGAACAAVLGGTLVWALPRSPAVRLAEPASAAVAPPLPAARSAEWTPLPPRHPQRPAEPSSATVAQRDVAFDMPEVTRNVYPTRGRKVSHGAPR